MAEKYLLQISNVFRDFNNCQRRRVGAFAYRLHMGQWLKINALCGLYNAMRQIEYCGRHK